MDWASLLITAKRLQITPYYAMLKSENSRKWVSVLAISQKIDSTLVSIHHTSDSLKEDSYALHCHNYFELFYFVKGNAGYRVEGAYYQPSPHSLLLIAPHAFHGIQIRAGQTYERYALHFLPELVEPVKQSFLLDSFHQSHIYYENCNDIIRTLFDFVLDTPVFSPAIREELLSCRVHALLTQVYEMTHTTSAAPLVSGESNEFVTRVIDYINQHLNEPLSLDFLSNYFFISKNHLNRTFRSSTGTTVGSYINHKRAVRAQEMMASGIPATTASLEAGFQDYSNFFRTYKQLFGHSPAQYRKKRKI